MNRSGLMYFASIYAYDSFMIGEISASLVGLPHRWIIKSVLALGIFMTILSGIAVWLQMALVLFGPKQNRFPLMTVEWPESGNTMIEGKERLDMNVAVDALAERAKAQAAKTAAAAAETKKD